MLIFFVQAEDGIRDGHVTGVQTCALPILSWRGRTIRPNEREYAVRLQYRVGDEGEFNDVTGQDGGVIEYRRSTKIGRASCRERVEIREEGVSLERKEVEGESVGLSRL